jgi:two-component system, OmpR family, heavy metal sensor histidine kinase CusS
MPPTNSERPWQFCKGRSEQALQQATLGSAAQQQVSHYLEEIHRLSSIVRKLLLSLADAGPLNFYKTSLNLSDLLAVMVEDVELVPQLTMRTDIAPDLSIWGAGDLIAQVLQNLISNAIKYNLENGWIEIQASLAGSAPAPRPLAISPMPANPTETMVQIRIANASRPITPSDRERIFDRFYRGDPARTRQIEGLGLGLSLAREIVHAHGGTLVLGGEAAADRTTFILKLPSGPAT